jgi:ABC-type bacteriocin/lantibiotic exporter with double-glycine peptidase domain
MSALRDSIAGQLRSRFGEHWVWYLDHILKRWRILTGLALVGAVLAAINIPLLWQLQRSLDSAMRQQDLLPLVWAVLIFLACRLTVAIVAIGVSRKSAPVLRRLGATMRVEIVEALHTRRWQDVAAMEDASVQAKLLHDTERVEQMTQSLFNSILPQIVPLAAYGLLAAWLSWKLTLMALVLGLILRLTSKGLYRILQSRTRTFQRQFELFHIDIVRVLFMMPVSMLLGEEKASIRRFSDETHRLADDGAKLSAAMVTTDQLGSLSSAAIIGLLLVAGAHEILVGNLTTGELLTFLITLRLANGAVSSALKGIPLAINADGALANLDLLRHSRYDLPSEKPAILSDDAHLRVRDVAFAYGDRPILEEISFDIGRGETMMIAAPNGEGKSTLLHIVAGVLRPDRGTATWLQPGQDDVSVIDSRPSIGVVPQHPRFFHASFRDNILCYRNHIADEAIEDALRQADLETIVARQPGGLDAILADGGQLLSGGERQRLALARALVNRPALLVLDEPTNHLDSGAVISIFERILGNPHAPAIIVATHDQRLLDMASRVYRLEERRLVNVQRPEPARS